MWYLQVSYPLLQIIEDSLPHDRMRKVKCDELKPVCKRCRSTGRACEGYGIWGGGGNGYAERYSGKKTHTSQLNLRSRAASLNLSDDYQEHLGWFHHQLVHDLSSRLAEGFWTALVMPALLNEPVIAHAAIALSVAHRDAALTPDATPLRGELVVMAHYNQSLRELQSAIESGADTTASLALVACLLYTLLERLRGRFEQAEMHLKSGLRLLKDHHRRLCIDTHGTTLLKRDSSVGSDQVKILQGFASLHLESQLLGVESCGLDILVQPSIEDVPPRAFRSIEEARYSLNKLIHAFLLLSQRFHRMSATERRGKFEDFDSHGQAFCLLQAWLKTYQATDFPGLQISCDRQYAHTVLLNHYEMAFVMWNHIGGNQESGYASQDARFLAIVEHSVELWSSLPSLSATQSTSIGDNLATPLFFTASKCRNRRIRLQAVRLLGMITPAQGSWNCRLMAKISKEVVALEENLDTDRGEATDHQISDITIDTDVKILKHSSLALICDVRIASLDITANALELRCKRWNGAGEMEAFNHHSTLAR
jgi:hypothetical protein